MPRQPSDSICRLNGVHVLSSIDVGDFDARTAIPGIAPAARCNICTVEAEAQIPHRAHVRRDSARTVPVSRVPKRDHAVAPPDRNVRTSRRVLYRVRRTGVRTQGVEQLQTRPVKHFHRPLTSRSKQLAPRIRESHRIELSPVLDWRAIPRLRNPPNALASLHLPHIDRHDRIVLPADQTTAPTRMPAQEQPRIPRLALSELATLPSAHTPSTSNPHIPQSTHAFAAGASQHSFLRRAESNLLNHRGAAGTQLRRALNIRALGVPDTDVGGDRGRDRVARGRP